MPYRLGLVGLGPRKGDKTGVNSLGVACRVSKVMVEPTDVKVAMVPCVLSVRRRRRR